MTNQERADLLVSEAVQVAEDLPRALDRDQWNLATRRAQEVIELVVKGLLSEIGIEYPRTHDPAPVLVETIRQRRLEADATFLDWLTSHSAQLAKIRGPAFYHEIKVEEPQARSAVEAANRVLVFGQEFLRRLRGKG